MLAGARATAVSLWNVSDEATRIFMVEFYRNMIHKGMSKGTALRATKIAMMDSARFYLPSYWAAFILYGE